MAIKDFSVFIKVFFLVLALAVFTAGCGSSEPEDEGVSIKLPGGSSISLDKSRGEVKISGEGGDFQIASSDSGIEYPLELKDELPLCPGYTPVQVTNISGHIGVMIKSSGSMDEVYEFYLEKAKAAGYEIGMTNHAGDVKMFMAENGPKNVVFTAGTNDDESVLVNIKYYSEE